VMKVDAYLRQEALGVTLFIDDAQRALKLLVELANEV